MVFVMSDIHGQYDKFVEMLNIIAFNNTDTLYILGDIIDRGPKNIDMVKKVMSMPNVKMILGNHEDMMLKYYKGGSLFEQVLWYENGGVYTDKEFAKLSELEKEQILKFFDNLPIEYHIEVKGQKFILVHGNYVSDEDKKTMNEEEYKNAVIWGRMNLIDTGPTDAIAILGHTCVSHFICDTPYHIYKQFNLINIDCGLAGYYHGNEKRRLGCLRLDDMKEFYC